MTADLNDGIRASRLRVPRSRGALSGFVLLILGAWAALVPFIGPYFNVAFTPAPNDAWNWTSGRGWLDVLPGVAAAVAGLVLLMGTNRLALTFASWLATAAGAWLVVGPALAQRLSISTGAPEPTSTAWVQTLDALLFYYAIGAAILFFGAAAWGRLSVHSVRDARAAQRRAEAEAARAEEERRLAEERVAREHAEREQAERMQAEQAHAGQAPVEPTQGGQAPGDYAGTYGQSGGSSPTGASTPTNPPPRG